MSDLAELATALAAAQAEMTNPRFDKVNPGFRSKYASLAAVRDAVIPVLSRHGIAVVQSLCADGAGRVGCTTRLIHKSGQEIESSLWLPATKQDAQGMGSAATYARRYSLMAMAGVVGDEDDDGNAAVASVKPTPAMAAQAPAPDYSVQEKALRDCASVPALQSVWKALSAAERRALSQVKDQVKSEIEMADAAAANA